uniref:Essential MCU regulator, mitochondrial n=1 Tax=Octopus bimaculoides TaxID=37653 RepID=A0A0L8FW51_OCTBM
MAAAPCRRILAQVKDKLHKTSVPVRTSVTTTTGAMLNKPPVTKFSMIKIMSTVVPFLYLGASVSRKGAAFLEENDIFVPDDDDDD